MLFGFLSPDAKFFQCACYGHTGLADEILETEYGTNSCNSVDKLCDLKWCVIQDGFVGFSGMFNQVFTQKQEEWLDEHYNEMNYD